MKKNVKFIHQIYFTCTVLKYIKYELHGDKYDFIIFVGDILYIFNTVNVKLM